MLQDTAAFQNTLHNFTKPKNILDKNRSIQYKDNMCSLKFVFCVRVCGPMKIFVVTSLNLDCFQIQINHRQSDRSSTLFCALHHKLFSCSFCLRHAEISTSQRGTDPHCQQTQRPLLSICLSVGQCPSEEEADPCHHSHH